MSYGSQAVIVHNTQEPQNLMTPQSGLIQPTEWILHLLLSEQIVFPEIVDNMEKTMAMVYFPASNLCKALFYFSEKSMTEYWM